MDMTIEQALQRAVETHKAGKLQEAETLYKAILQIQLGDFQNKLSQIKS